MTKSKNVAGSAAAEALPSRSLIVLRVVRQRAFSSRSQGGDTVESRVWRFRIAQDLLAIPVVTHSTSNLHRDVCQVTGCGCAVTALHIGYWLLPRLDAIYKVAHMRLELIFHLLDPFQFYRLRPQHGRALLSGPRPSELRDLVIGRNHRVGKYLHARAADDQRARRPNKLRAKACCHSARQLTTGPTGQDCGMKSASSIWSPPMPVMSSDSHGGSQLLQLGGHPLNNIDSAQSVVVFRRSSPRTSEMIIPHLSKGRRVPAQPLFSLLH